MSVHVICRLNQARSIITSAVIRKLYPELKVYSSGIQAQTGSPIPTLISSIGQRWGLEEIDHSSTLFGVDEPPKEDDLVLCADTSIFLHLKNLGVPGRLIDVTKYALRESLVPSDPVSMPVIETEVELAKMVTASLRALEVEEGLGLKNKLSALFYLEPLSGNLQEQLSSWLRSTSGVAIDMNWRIPDSAIWQVAGVETNSFNPRRLSINEEKVSSSVLYSDFEIDNQIDLLTRPTWIEFLSSIDKPVLLLIPEIELQGPNAAESILSLASAQHIHEVSSPA